MRKPILHLLNQAESVSGCKIMADMNPSTQQLILLCV